MIFPKARNFVSYSALRAGAAGFPLDMTSYIAWREWDTGLGEMDQEVNETGQPENTRVPMLVAWGMT